MTFCPLITLTLKIISARCILLNLRSKTRRRATLLLPTWIYTRQSVGTVNFTLPFTTNVEILISILQTFRSRVATSHPRPPMTFISHNSSDTPWLAPLMNVLFWGLVRLSNKLLGQGYVKERLESSLRKFKGRYGDLTKQYEAPLSRMLHDILEDDHIQWHPPLMRHYTNFDPLLIWTLLPNLTFYIIVWGFHRTFATGAACQQRTLTPLDTWSYPTLGLASVLMLRPISHELVCFRTFDFRTSLGTSVFAYISQNYRSLTEIIVMGSENIISKLSLNFLDHMYLKHKIQRNNLHEWVVQNCFWYIWHASVGK